MLELGQIYATIKVAIHTGHPKEIVTLDKKHEKLGLVFIIKKPTTAFIEKYGCSTYVRYFYVLISSEF